MSPPSDFFIARGIVSTNASVGLGAKPLEKEMQVDSIALAAPTDACTAQEEKEENKITGAGATEQRDLFVRAPRRKLPDERKSITHKFSVGGHEGYIIVGMYEQGAPGEIFMVSAGLADARSCSTCGMLMVPNGSCYKCVNCGSTSGCS